MGRHSRRANSARAAGRRVGAVAVMAAGMLLGGAAWQTAVADTMPSCGCQNPGDDEDDPPPPSHGPNNGLLIIDNSNADSWLEVDRTLNTLISSQGTAGSDHDGDGGDVVNGAPRQAGSPQTPASTAPSGSREPEGARSPGSPEAAGPPGSPQSNASPQPAGQPTASEGDD